METWPWARQALQLEMAKLVSGKIEDSSKSEDSHKMEEQAFQDVEKCELRRGTNFGFISAPEEIVALCNFFSTNTSGVEKL